MRRASLVLRNFMGVYHGSGSSALHSMGSNSSDLTPFLYVQLLKDSSASHATTEDKTSNTGSHSDDLTHIQTTTSDQNK